MCLIFFRGHALKVLLLRLIHLLGYLDFKFSPISVSADFSFYCSTGFTVFIFNPILISELLPTYFVKTSIPILPPAKALLIVQATCSMEDCSLTSLILPVETECLVNFYKIRILTFQTVNESIILQIIHLNHLGLSVEKYSIHLFMR